MDFDDVYGDELPDWLNEADEDESEYNYGEFSFPGAYHLLLLIDCHVSMFQEIEQDPENEHRTISLFDIVLRHCERIIRERARRRITQRTGQRDSVGILLFNTLYRKPHNLENDRLSTVHELVALAPPGTQAVKTLKNAQKDELRIRRFDIQALYCNTDPLNETKSPLQIALFEANRILQRANIKNEDMGEICIFTNQTFIPPESMTYLRTQVEDAKQVQARVCVIPLKGQSGNFEEIGFIVQESVHDLNWKKARRSHFLPLVVTDDEHPIMIDLYKTVQAQQRLTEITVHNETGVKLDREVQLIAGTDILAKGRRLTEVGEKRLRQYVTIGKQDVYIHDRDIAEIKRSCNASSKASLMLLGFKEKSEIPFYHNMGCPYFAYPNDDFIPGSCEAFSYLHDSMVRKQVVGIAELLVRSNATSRLAALIPLEEELNEEEELVRPAGLLIVYIPFADEMKAIEPDLADKSLENGIEVANEDLIDAFRSLIKKQTLPHSIKIGEVFDNVAVRRQWDYVESVALEEPLPDLGLDVESHIDQDLIKSRTGDAILRINTLLPDDLETLKATKRELPHDSSEVDWHQTFLDNALEKLTTGNLKDYLRSKGLPSSGRKAELVARVEANIYQEYAVKKIKTET